MKFRELSNEELLEYEKSLQTIPRRKLTLQEKFERISKRKEFLKEHHYQLVLEGEGTFALFSGTGRYLKSYPLTIEGIRLARIFAVTRFINSERQFGGYLFG